MMKIKNIIKIILLLFAQANLEAFPYAYSKLVLKDKDGKEIKTVEVWSDCHAPKVTLQELVQEAHQDTGFAKERDILFQMGTKFLSFLQKKELKFEDVINEIKALDTFGIKKFRKHHYFDSDLQLMESLKNLDKTTTEKIDLLWEHCGFYLNFLKNDIKCLPLILADGFDYLWQSNLQNINLIESDLYRGITFLLNGFCYDEVNPELLSLNLPAKFILEELEKFTSEDHNPIVTDIDQRIDTICKFADKDNFISFANDIITSIRIFAKAIKSLVTDKELETFTLNDLISKINAKQKDITWNWFFKLKDNLFKNVLNLELLIKALGSKNNKIIIFAGGIHCTDVKNYLITQCQFQEIEKINVDLIKAIKEMSFKNTGSLSLSTSSIKAVIEGEPHL